MKKSIIKKVISFSLIFIFLLIAFSFTKRSEASGVINSALEAAKPDNLAIDSRTQNIGNKVLSAVKVISIAIAIGCIILEGVLYVTSDPNKLSELKTNLIYLFFGAVLIFTPIFVVDVLFKTGQTIQ